MKFMKPTGSGIFALVLSTLSLSANAAGWNTCDGRAQTWRSNSTNMYLSTISMPIGSIWDLRAQYMMGEWNSVGGSNFRYYFGRDTDGSTNTSNGVNEVSFQYKPSETYLGVTNYRYNCYWLFGWHYGLIEADIHLNTRYSWTTGQFTGEVTSSPYNYDLVMLHELGHALGLNHCDGRPDIMNTYYFNGGPNGHYNYVEPHGDDRFGLRILYPDGSTDRDISASKFRNTGGGSSSLNWVYTTSGGITFNVTKGNQYDLQYTMENLGTQTEDVLVHFYISTNSYISTSDTYLGSTSWSMPSGSYFTANKRITIPSSLASSTYYLGYRVDPNGTIPESDEFNNFVALVNAVTVQ